jgi:hypothetical protein
MQGERYRAAEPNANNGRRNGEHVRRNMLDQLTFGVSMSCHDVCERQLTSFLPFPSSSCPESLKRKMETEEQARRLLAHPLTHQSHLRSSFGPR